MKADWRRIEEVFLAALEQPAEKRATFVETTCGDDASLREDVVAMLRSHEETGDFLETPAYQINAALLADQSGSLKIGEQLGDYRILSLLGEGGMGEVYLAEDLSLGRQVALKLVRPGFGGANLLRQFQREERILAGLTHPNIARLYGGAVSSAGVPYFVMEYVEGERLDAFCAARQLTIPERLQLFRKVCAAVSYAHQHLVIHRDLKPANIRVGADGEPKLLDFGIAKLLDDESAAALEQTMTLTGAMTPGYASPEQLRGEAMTTATDVYSLGVILFELLTGTKPYQTKSRRIDEISRAITDQEPIKPSTACGASFQLAKTRDLKSRATLLRGDLDNIVLTAIRKEPARRYSSVSQLSDDIRRHLEGLPVTARKDTLTYRASKFVARNRIAVSVALLMLGVILSALIFALREAKNARRQRDVAQRINTFLQGMLTSAAPDVRGIDIKVSDVLGEAARRAKQEAQDQPDVMADVLLSLGRTYVSLSQFPPAEDTLRAALAASLRANGESHLTTARIMAWLGITLFYQNKVTEGEAFSRKALALLPQLPSSTPEDRGVALYAVGLNLIHLAQAKAAQPFLEEAVEVLGKNLGERHGYYMAAIVMLAKAKEDSGDLVRAESLYRQAIEVGQKIEYRYRIFLAQASGYLGSMLRNKGNYAEAERMYRLSEAVYLEQEGDSGSSVGAVRQYLGSLYLLQGNYAAAEAELKKSQIVLSKSIARDHPAIFTGYALLGLTLTRAGKPEEGEPYLRQALEGRKRVLPSESYLIPLTESALGECLTAQKLYPEAEPLLTNGYNELKAKLGDQNTGTIEARQRLAKLYDAWNKPEQAALFR